MDANLRKDCILFLSEKGRHGLFQLIIEQVLRGRNDFIMGIIILDIK